MWFESSVGAAHDRTHAHTSTTMEHTHTHAHAHAHAAIPAGIRDRAL